MTRTTKPNTTRIHAEWVSFVHACDLVRMSKLQYIDMRRAFFGGVAAFMHAANQSPEEESEEDFLADVMTELQLFNEDVKAGRA